MATLLILGFTSLGIAALWVLAEWGGLSRRLPTQVLSRRAALYPLVVGAALIVSGLAVGLAHGFA